VISWVLTFWTIPDWYWRESLLHGVLTNNTDDDDSTALHLKINGPLAIQSCAPGNAGEGHQVGMVLAMDGLAY
jgi:hypothetical protein